MIRNKAGRLVRSKLGSLIKFDDFIVDYTLKLSKAQINGNTATWEITDGDIYDEDGNFNDNIMCVYIDLANLMCVRAYQLGLASDEEYDPYSYQNLDFVKEYHGIINFKYCNNQASFYSDNLYDKDFENNSSMSTSENPITRRMPAASVDFTTNMEHCTINTSFINDSDNYVTRVRDRMPSITFTASFKDIDNMFDIYVGHFKYNESVSG